MSKLSPVSTSSTASSESADSSPTFRSKRYSDESDDSDDSSLEWDWGSSVPTSKDKEKDKLHPVTSRTGKEFLVDPKLQPQRMMNEKPPSLTPGKSDQTVVPSIPFKYSLQSDWGSSVPPTSKDKEKDKLHPVTSSTGKEFLVEHRDKINHSPAASYTSMKSDQSMNAPLKFRHEPDVTPTSYGNELSPCPTVASFHSMDPPIKFILSDPKLQTQRMMNEKPPSLTPDKSDQTVVPSIPFKYRDPYTHQMMREHLRCTECKDVLKEPVSIPCGHSFCKSCILTYWTRPPQIGHYSCPQCRKRFTTRPALNLNVTLANMVQTHQRAGFSPAVPAQSYAGPGDVACDICTRSKIRAVKTCRTCMVSYCEAHVRKHYTVEALQKHVLLEPTKDLKRGGVNKLGKANTAAEVTVPKDLVSSLMKQMKQLQNHVNDMALKLEDMQRSKTEDEPPRKRSRAQLEKGLRQ